MKLDELRQRRSARRSRRQRTPSPWGTASLIVGAGSFVVIYLLARSCAHAPPPRSGPLTIEVSPTGVCVDGQVVVPPEAPIEELETRLVRHLTGRSSVGTPEVQGRPGVTFARLQAVARAVERAGLGKPRLVNPRADRRVE